MEYKITGDREEKQGIFKDDTFIIRFAIATVFFVLVLFWDLTDKTFMGTTVENLYQAVKFDFGKVIEFWVITAGNITPL